VEVIRSLLEPFQAINTAEIDWANGIRALRFESVEDR
jgi:hypothetical protein